MKSRIVVVYKDLTLRVVMYLVLMAVRCRLGMLVQTGNLLKLGSRISLPVWSLILKS
jgi:hypothetical protein